MAESFVILGDGIAGSSAAETIREAAPEVDITIVTDEGEPLYNRILTKEFAKGKLPEAPLAIHEASWYADRDITLELDTYVTTIHPDEHTVETHRGDVIEYDKLLCATGGTPQQLPVPNSDADGVHHFWTFQDARRIANHAEEADRAVIVGAGLLGIDFAGICGARGVQASYIMRGECWWRYAMSPEGADIIHKAMSDRGVEPILDSGVERFEVDDDGHITGAVDANGERHEADFAGVAIGLDFNTEYLQGTDVEVDDGIVVDEHMRTAVEDVYAAGDITQFYDVILGDRNQNGSWGSAKEQGSIAGTNMVEGCGTATFEWVPSYSITHFDFPFLSFGHPTIGSEGPVTEGDPNGVVRRYDDQEWRRLVFRDGRLIGGVLVGDLAPQSAYKTLIRERRPVRDQVETLLEQTVDLDALAPPQEQ